MKTNKRLYVGLGVAGAVVLVLWLSVGVGQSRRKYEVETQVYDLPEHRSDGARAIDAYERLMERYMDLTEHNLFNVSADVKMVATRLDAIHAELAALNARLARIEKHLGIQPAPVAASSGDANAPPPPPVPRIPSSPSSVLP